MPYLKPLFIPVWIIAKNAGPKVMEMINPKTIPSKNIFSMPKLIVFYLKILPTYQNVLL